MGDDKKKYVSAEEATGENEESGKISPPIEEFKPFTDLDIDLDKTGENVKDSIEKAAPFLKRIDGFIFKYWKVPYFIYFLFALFISINTDYDDIFRSSLYQEDYISISPLISNLLLLWSPIIIIAAWKRLFHPNN